MIHHSVVTASQQLPPLKSHFHLNLTFTLIFTFTFIWEMKSTRFSSNFLQIRGKKLLERVLIFLLTLSYCSSDVATLHDVTLVLWY